MLPVRIFFIHERLRQLGHASEARHRSSESWLKAKNSSEVKFFFRWLIFFLSTDVSTRFGLLRILTGFVFFDCPKKNPGEDLFEETEAAKNINEPIKKVTKIKLATIKLVEDDHFLNPFPIKLLHQM